MRALVILASISMVAAFAQDRKLTDGERIEIIRGMTAEYATAKILLPRSNKPLVLQNGGARDEKQWADAERSNGPAARSGDLIQITKVNLQDKRIEFEVNGGMKGGRKWYERIEVGTGSRTTPIGSRTQSVAPSGTSLALVFPGRVPPLKAAEIKGLLAPILNFQHRSASESYLDSLPPEIQSAVRAKKAIEGMNRETVLAALGQPRNKVRTTLDGTEYEDWIYGDPPGRVVFVTFEGDEVVRVKESYAGLGGSTAPPLPSPR